MSTLEEFRRNILNVEGNRHHRVTNSYGVYDAFKYYRKHRPKNKEYVLTESQYFAIIRQINNLLADELVHGNEVPFKAHMGNLELRKIEIAPKIVNGILVFNAPIDWDKTIKLWYEDEESFKNKVLVKVEEREVFKIYYNKSRANYENKSFYEFSANRELKKRVARKIKEGRIDAFLLKKKPKYG